MSTANTPVAEYDYSEDLAGMPRQIDRLREALSNKQWGIAFDIAVAQHEAMLRIAHYADNEKFKAGLGHYNVACTNGYDAPKLP